jgi:general stress protein CsbA
VTARFWRYTGGEVPEAGAFLGIALAFCSIAVLALTLAELRNARVGTLMALVLVGTPNYLDYATSQYADIPIGFFFLGALALIVLHFEREPGPERMRILAFAGFFAGCAGWTKNEGIVFLVAASAALLLPVIRERSETLRRFAAFAAGAALPVLVIVLFKLTNPVNNYVVAYEPGKLQKALDWDRHAMILRYLGQFIFSFGGWSFSPYIPLILLIIVTGISWRVFRSQGWLTIVLTLVFLSAGYYFVYLTTPVPLKIHIESSLDRLLLQLWPSLLLAAGLICEPNPGPGGKMKAVSG